MKKRLIITLLICLTIAYSCEEPMEINAEGQKVTLEEMDPLQDNLLMDLLPSVVQGSITNGRSLETELGEVDLSKAIKVENPFDTITRYTLRFIEENSLAFENLIIKQSNQGVNSYIIKYEPDVNWLVSKGGVFENKSFTGKLFIKSIDRTIIAEAVFENGIGINYKYFSSTNGKTNCDGSSSGGSGGGSGGGGGGGGGGSGGGGSGGSGGSGGGGSGGGGSGGSGGSGGGGSGGGSGGGGSGGDSGGGGGEPCDWWTSQTTGGLVIDCPGLPLQFILRTACDPFALPDYKICPGDDSQIPVNAPCPEDPIGILPPDYQPIEIWEAKKIDDTLLKPCMQGILSDVKNLTQGSVGQIIQKFSGTIPGYNWELKDGALAGNQNAFTSQAYNKTTGTVTTTFDGSKLVNATDLSIARTILHESVHAYLVSYFKIDPLSASKSYPDLVGDWAKGIYGDQNTNQHAEFVRNFVSDITIALEEFGVNRGLRISSQFYQDLAWGGLTHTGKLDSSGNPIETAWFQTAFPSSVDRKRIVDNINIELTGKDFSGITKTQKGVNAGC